MMYAFSPGEIFEVAMQIERNGAAFYRKAAAFFEQTSQRDTLLMLADMEDKHLETFRRMRSALPDEAQPRHWSDPEGEAMGYLRAFAAGRVFDMTVEPAEFIRDDSTMGEILIEAVKRERDSVMFYLGVKEAVVGDDDKTQVDAVIREEMSHITILNDQLDLLGGAVAPSHLDIARRRRHEEAAMSNEMKALRVADHVQWVGAVDWELRDFHGYTTERGSTYNAFLVMGEAIALIDTVKAPFMDEMMARIRSVCDPSDIRYLISNHAEMDHTGCLPQTMAAIKPERVLASTNGVKALRAHFDGIEGIETVADGETLSLGNLNLSFHETRMLHWPDSMVAHLAEDKLLFSQDAFGMHLATHERFDDEVGDDVLEHEAAKYFANILMPYASLVGRAINKLGALDIATIAPDHGPIWREDPQRVLDWYARWAEQKPARKAVILYDTMWGSTAMMAEAIAEGARAGGIDAQCLSMHQTSRAHAARAVLEAGALLVGSPTMNNEVFPTIADVMTYLKGLRPKNLVAAAFGSYGWGGEAVKHLNEFFAAMKLDILNEGLRVQYVPTPDDLARCRTLGRQTAQRVIALCEAS